MILILDCNIWVTLTLNREVDIISDLSNGGFILASCTELRDEIIDVLNRPKFANVISGSSIEKVVQLHDLVTKTYKIGKLVKITADSKDDYLFALALKAKADYLITGDKLLLGVAKYKRTQIITLAQLRLITQTL